MHDVQLNITSVVPRCVFWGRSSSYIDGRATQMVDLRLSAY